jgi:proton-coupled amino acid transporter
VPLSWVRKIEYFSITSLIGDGTNLLLTVKVFILAGLTYILGFDLLTIAKQGVAPDVILGAHTKALPLLIGTIMFSFEGICLMLPIAASMKEPQKFERTLSISFVVTCFICT